MKRAFFYPVHIIGLSHSPGEDCFLVQGGRPYSLAVHLSKIRVALS